MRSARDARTLRAVGYASFKRLTDVFVAGTGLIGLSPVLLALAAAVRLDSPGPALFRHERLGLHGRKFRLLKFRSMTSGSTGAQVTAGGDRRVTRVGRFLRRTKLDELPQLWNVLSGDMSLVGPRPEVERYVNAYPDDYREILEVPPGITDYAAIEYRHEEELLAAATDPEKVYVQVVLPAKIALYRRYLAERSTVTDVAILARTLAALCRRASKTSSQELR